MVTPFNTPGYDRLRNPLQINTLQGEGVKRKGQHKPKVIAKPVRFSETQPSDVYYRSVEDSVQETKIGAVAPPLVEPQVTEDEVEMELPADNSEVTPVIDAGPATPEAFADFVANAGELTEKPENFDLVQSEETVNVEDTIVDDSDDSDDAGDDNTEA